MEAIPDSFSGGVNPLWKPKNAMEARTHLPSLHVVWHAEFTARLSSFYLALDAIPLSSPASQGVPATRSRTITPSRPRPAANAG